MNTFTIWIVVFAVFVTMGGVIYALIRDRKAQKKEQLYSQSSCN